MIRVCFCWKLPKTHWMPTKCISYTKHRNCIRLKKRVLRFCQQLLRLAAWEEQAFSSNFLSPPPFKICCDGKCNELQTNEKENVRWHSGDWTAHSYDNRQMAIKRQLWTTATTTGNKWHWIFTFMTFEIERIVCAQVGDGSQFGWVERLEVPSSGMGWIGEFLDRAFLRDC